MFEGNKVDLVVLGTPKHEGQICGRAFDLLKLSPAYIDPARPEIPLNPAPKAVLLSREWNPELRYAGIQARRAGIPVVYIMDGVIEWAQMWENWSYIKPDGTLFQPLISSHLCVIGQHPARILAALGLADRVHVVGMPRLDGLKRRRIIDRDRPPQFLIATAKTFGHNTAHKVYVRAALRDLRDWFEGHRELIPIWRISAELAEDLGVAASSEGPVTNLIESASGVIAFTSTVLLEAMRLGVPTAQIDYRAVPQLIQTAWEIRNPEQIENVIRELLYPPAEKLAFQDWCLNDELEPGDASRRLAEVIRSTLDSSSDPGAEKVAPNQGLIDFKQINSHLSAFSVGPLSRLQYELDATYKLWERDRQKLNAKDQRADNFEATNALLAELRIDPLARLILSLQRLPGFKRLARIIRSVSEDTGGASR